MNQDEIIRRDLERICYHEAGHLVVLKELGGHGFIKVDEEADTTDLMNTTSRAARMHTIEHPGGDEARRMVGLAGIIAEAVYDEGPDVDAVGIMEMMDMEDQCLSPSDAKAADGYTPETVKATLRLLLDNWDKVEHHAFWQIQKASTAES